MSIDLGATEATGEATGTSLPSTPPASVLDAIGKASDAYDSLAAEGKHVSFGTDPETGAFTATLEHADGSAEQISGSDALTLASGEDI